MSVRDKAVLLWVICLSYEVIMTSCEVVLVNRNVTDSFRVGKDGCTNNTSVCPSSATCQPDSGLCLCGNQPNFRNPDLQTDDGKIYGCMSGISIRSGLASGLHCDFKPFQLIPNSHNEPAAQFSQEDTMRSCFLNTNNESQAKFPNNTNEMDLQWLDESYVNLTVSNNMLYFKWKRSVPGLRGSIITLHLRCAQIDKTFVSKCLRAKVFGTWTPDKSHNEQTHVATTEPAPAGNTEPNTPTTKADTWDGSPNATITKSASNYSLGPITITAVVVPVILFLVFVGAVWWLCIRKRGSRNQDNDLKTREMQNNEEQTRTDTGDEANVYEVAIEDTHTDGVSRYAPSTSSDHQYEELSNYEPLRRNPLQDQSDDHQYQSLITSQTRK